ncbi:MAG: DoxX family protein [Gammaproteobacteria bacterium]|nr:DoxX family protein [Gammaproteobacteria bacterium]
MTFVERTMRLSAPVIRVLESASPLLDFGIRVWVANIFFRSGFASLQDWESTLDLFKYEYKVPLLAPQAAAVLGTGAELIFPAFLAIGLATRFNAAALFAFNLMAVISYPALNEVGLKDHTYWGILLLVILLHGPGKISVDYFISRKWSGK